MRARLAKRAVRWLLQIACLACWCSQAAAQLAIDGSIDEQDWREALVCSDWKRVAPYALDEPRYGNRLLLLPTAEGLAAAFIVDQPPSERRIRTRSPRDAEQLVGDSVSLMIDYAASGLVGYEFSVALGGGVRDGLVTNQNRFDRDWDGLWRHAVHESEHQWSVELIIPWSTVNVSAAQADTQTIGVYASRYVHDRDEEYACPGVSSESAAFLSDFRRFNIAVFATGQQLEVAPYGTAVRDLLRDETSYKAGLDLTWRASPNFWLAAALNPDFGQVESDELVVDFSAIETVFTDKRPFFTQNQGLFDVRTPANGQLIYTRRIGAPPDDLRAGYSDIDGALKAVGSAGALTYGGFMAQEDDYDSDVGRLFAAGRLSLPLDALKVGYLGTWTDRPLLERRALINAVDAEFTPDDWWRFAGQIVRSDIETASWSAADYQAWVQADLNRSGSLTHTLKLLHIGDQFDVNDLGYMERNALEYVEWDTRRRIAGDGAGRINGEVQRFYAYYRENAGGERLQSRLQLSRDVQYLSAWRAYQEVRYLTSGVDDLLSRGNGPVQLGERWAAYFDLISPRYGDWQWLFGGYLYEQGVAQRSARLQFLVNWFPTEMLALRFDLLPHYSKDWLLWERGNLFGSYEAERLDADLSIDWIPSPQHELRLKWQWIGVDAAPRRAYRTDPEGALLRSEDVLAPFTVSSLGLQIRYRYEFAAGSELFVVYARGGFAVATEDDRGLSELFGDLGQVRDADQVLIKFRYRMP